MIGFIPGAYYYSSRYDLTGGFFHFFKYWIFLLFAFCFFESGFPDLNFAFSLLLFFLAHLCVYDQFCFSNDKNFSSEKNGTDRSGGKVILPPSFIFSAAFCLLFFLILGLLDFFSGYFFVYLIFLSSVFFLHNSLVEKFRVLTYFALYIIKTFLPVFAFSAVEGSFFVSIFYVYFAIAFSFSYVPAYALKKFGFHAISLKFKAVYFKIFLLSCLSFINLVFLVFSVFVFIVTALELFIKKISHEKNNSLDR